LDDFWPSYVDRSIVQGSHLLFARPTGPCTHASAKTADWNGCARALLLLGENNNNNNNNRRSKNFRRAKIFSLSARDVSRVVNADNVHAMLWSEASAHNVGNGNGDNPVRA
jgi:hypothetical protein